MGWTTSETVLEFPSGTDVFISIAPILLCGPLSLVLYAMGDGLLSAWLKSTCHHCLLVRNLRMDGVKYPCPRSLRSIGLNLLKPKTYIMYHQL